MFVFVHFEQVSSVECALKIIVDLLSFSSRYFKGSYYNIN